MVRIWKSEGQDLEYSWFFSGLVWRLVLIATCHKLVTWVGSLTYRIYLIILIVVGKFTPKCGWHFQRQPRWNMAEATSSGHWVSLSCWPCCCYYSWHQNLLFPGFNHWLRTKGSPGNFQVLGAWLGLLKYSVSRTEQLLGYQTPHCETANMGLLFWLLRHPLQRLSSHWLSAFQVWDSCCYYSNIKYLINSIYTLFILWVLISRESQPTHPENHWR